MILVIPIKKIKSKLFKSKIDGVPSIENSCIAAAKNGKMKVLKTAH